MVDGKGARFVEGKPNLRWCSVLRMSRVYKGKALKVGVGASFNMGVESSEKTLRG